MDNTTIKDNIRKIRKARKLTQEQMALSMDISLTAYRDLEKGKTSIINDNLTKIADLLDTSTEEIVLGYRPMQAEGRQIEDVRAEYGLQIDVLKTRVSDLEKLVKHLEDSVDSKNEIISMLKKSLDQAK